jgi:hypothetical protein
MKTKMIYLLIATLIASGCALHKKATVKQQSSPKIAKQATAPLDASTVLPLLRKFKPEMGMEYILDVLGEPSVNVGSAVYSYFYLLTDGKNVHVQAHINHNYTPASGESKYGPVIKIEHGGEIIYDSRR